ncbi:hypothetical protein ABZ896_04965 [Streptomyces sp. NPDC047072]|uniref:SCO4225 family membrane protein n=1 Tax=Streptomyces sp. NPDC047072 TaxID=3154809 RepID=UPI0033D88746
MSFAARSRAVLALAWSNRLSRGYLAVVEFLACYAYFEDSYLKIDTMFYVVPTVLTAPTNFLFTIAFGWVPTDAPFYLGLALGAVVNAIVLGALVQLVRKRRPSTTDPAPTV